MAVSVTVRQQNRGYTILVEVTPETVTVRQFKVMLAQDVGIRARRQSLTINGREMEDNQTLSYYGVAANSTIIVDEERDYGEVRFKGGGAIIGDFLHELETESSTSSGSD